MLGKRAQQSFAVVSLLCRHGFPVGSSWVVETRKWARRSFGLPGGVSMLGEVDRGFVEAVRSDLDGW
jgi:hypothetical protein